MRRALSAGSREAYYATLSELVAQLEDGHGYVYGRNATLGGFPISVTLVDGQLAVAATGGDTPLRRGDVVLQVDDMPAMDVLLERERLVLGSPHLRRYRALNQFGEGALESIARVVVLRDGKSLPLDVPRPRERRGFFYNAITPFAFPDFAEVSPGIF